MIHWEGYHFEKIISAGKGVEGLASLYIADNDITWCNHFGNNLAVLQSIKNSYQKIQQCHFQLRIKTHLHEEHARVCTAALLIIPKPKSNPNAHYLTNRYVICGISTQGNIMQSLKTVHTASWMSLENMLNERSPRKHPVPFI